MQKKDKAYAFHITRKSKNRIFIKRVAVSKMLVHSGAAGVIFAFFLSTVALGATMISSSAIAENFDSFTIVSQVKAAANAKAAIAHDAEDISIDELSFNSGGPEEINENSDPATIEEALATIEKSTDPQNIPSIWAHSGKINNEFRFRRNPFGGRSYEFHNGMDIDGERGQPVVAPANGTIVKAAWSGGYGNMIEIDHGNGLTTRYGHLSKVEVSEGSPIMRGMLIGYVGSTGRSTGPHLHYELRINDKPINPRRFLPTEPLVIPTADK
jgi:murein DD-endopeptidase MepM/ murein hydrolase activator NlpD